MRNHISVSGALFSHGHGLTKTIGVEGNLVNSGFEAADKKPRWSKASSNILNLVRPRLVPTTVFK